MMGCNTNVSEDLAVSIFEVKMETLHSEDECSMNLRNVGIIQYTASKLVRS
jgi:hypothetical protein